MKEFNLEEAKAGKPVCTRDGRKARILCYDFKYNDEYPNLVAVENYQGQEWAFLYSNDGICEKYKESNCELVMLPEKKEGWVNVYKDNLFSDILANVSSVYPTKEEAMECRNDKDYIGTFHFEWEE